ncbi:hypothetical protein ACOMHN_007946 [Nucella lapillus]
METGYAYDFVRILGKGGFGVVAEAIETATGQKQAVKFVTALDAADRELMVNMSFRHDLPDCIVRIDADFIINEGFCMVFEMMEGGDLHNWLHHHHPGGVPLKVFKGLARRMFQALHYLQGKSILHADIKENNFLLANPADPNTLKLGDFGMARIMTPSQAPVVFNNELHLIEYRAPEVMLGTPTNNLFSPDLWATGCVLMHTLLRRSFFPCRSDQTDRSMLNEQFRFLGKPPRQMLDKSRHAGRLLKDPSEYPKNSKQLLQFFLDRNPHWMPLEVICVNDLVRRTLDVNPESRIRPQAALNHPFLRQ